MKKCPECGLDLPDEVLYCLYCGTKTNISKLVKTNRRVFFLFPFFIILICFGLLLDTGSLTIIETGLNISGIAIGVYFLGAFILGFFHLFFKITIDSDSYLLSALSSIVNAITTVFFVYVLVNHYYEDYFEKLGPSVLMSKYFLVLLSSYLIVQIVETIAIAIKAKVSLINSNNAFLKYIHITIPLIYIIITAVCFTLSPAPIRIAFYSEYLMTVSANEKADVCVSKGLESYPENAKLCFLKATILTELETFKMDSSYKNLREEVLKYAKIASEEKPDSPLYKFLLSTQYEINQEPNKSLRYADEAANLAKDDSFLWLNLGNLNLKHSHYSEACDAYKKVLSVDPNNASALNNLSYTLLTNNKNLPLALELAKQAVEIMPNGLAIRDTLAWAYYKNNQFTNALETINLIYENRKDVSPEIDFHYAAILDSMGLLNNSLETYDKMLVKPEVAVNKSLVNQIIEARNKAEEKIKDKLKGK